MVRVLTACRPDAVSQESQALSSLPFSFDQLTSASAPVRAAPRVGQLKAPKPDHRNKRQLQGAKGSRERAEPLLWVHSPQMHVLVVYIPSVSPATSAHCALRDAVPGDPQSGVALDSPTSPEYTPELTATCT